MKAPALPANESLRLETLRSLNILDTPLEERFDRLTRLAQRLFGVPIALISLVDERRQWFKSHAGLTATETPRDLSFCGHSILSDEVLVVPDTVLDDRFQDNPLVSGDPRIRFYAGHPLSMPNGSMLGTFCIIDRKPRDLTSEDLFMLSDLAKMATEEISEVQRTTLVKALANAEHAVADAELRVRLEGRFRQVVEAAPNAMIMVDREGRMTLVNTQAEKLFGYDREELIGQKVEMLIPLRISDRHPELRHGYFGRPDARPMGAGRDLYGLTKDKREVPIEIGLNPIKAEEGTLVLASIIDISERKRLEQGFRLLVESVQDYAILLLDKDGRVSSWNAGAQRIKGYSAEEIVGKHFSCFYPPEDIAAGKPEKELVTATKVGRVEDESWRVRKDGTRYWANTVITALRDEQGTLRGFSKVSRDLTERKRLETRFRLAVEAAPNAMIMVNQAGDITLVNAQTEKLFGYDREELLGKKIDMLVPQRVRGRHPDLRGGYFHNPATRSMGVGRDLFGLTRSGKEVPIEIGLNPIDTEEGPFVLASIIDITERKRAEIELQALNKSLESQVSETRATLARLQETQNQLVQAEKMASLGGLVAGVAHEINTPIGIGVTAASHLADQVSNLARASAEGRMTKTMFERSMESLMQSSDIILTNLERGAELIQSFKRVAVDQSSDERRPVNLKQYIGEVLTSLKPRLKQSPIQIELNCPDNLEIETVPGALSQILTNLVMNALIHAYNGSTQGTIRIVVERDRERTRLIFSDDGCGIPPENLGRVFDPFFTTSRSKGGTGLGLHIVFNIVHQTLGGTIDVASTPGHGTSFIIKF